MPKFLKTIWDEFVYGGQLHSIGIALVILAATIIIGVPANIYFLITVYSGIHSAYLFNRYKEIDNDISTNPERSAHVQLYIKYIPFLVGFLLLISLDLLLVFGNVASFLLGGVMFLIGLLYSIFLKKYTVRVPLFKNFFIGISFSSLLILYYFYANLNINLYSIIPIIFLFILIVVRSFSNTIFFDIKDIKIDKQQNLKTYPAIYGFQKAITLIRILNVVSGLILVVGITMHYLPIYSIILLLLIPYTEFYVKKSQHVSANLGLISALYADGEYSLWFFLIIIGRFIYEQF